MEGMLTIFVLGYIAGIFIVPYLLQRIEGDPGFYHFDEIPAAVVSAFLWPLSLLVFTFRRLRRRMIEGRWSDQ